MGSQLLRLNTMVVFVIIVIGIFIGPVEGQANCPNGEYYKPCTCSYYNGQYDVRCEEVRVEEVVNVFNRTTPSHLQNFYVSVFDDASTDSTVNIPKDFLSEHQVNYKIVMNCSNSNYSVQMEQEAFRISKNFTKLFYLVNCDIDRLSFNFLTGFDQLSHLHLSTTSNVHMANWTSLPPLPNLKILEISDSTGLNDWQMFPSSIRGLEKLYLPSNDIQGVAMDRILNWTIENSVNTLTELILDRNDLTVIPLQIPTYTSLRSVRIDNQKTGIPIIPTGSIKLSGSEPRFYSVNNKITAIETGAFQGDFAGAYVGLSGNDIETVKAGVFQGNFTRAEVDLSSNKIKTIEPGAFTQGYFNGASLDLSKNEIQTIEPGIFQVNFIGARIYLSSNGIQTIEPGAFRGNFAGSYLGLSSNNISTIQPGVFQGDFSDATLSMSSNNIQVIEPEAFKGNFSGAYVYLNYNTIKNIESGAFQGDFIHTFLYLYDNNIQTIQPGALHGHFRDVIIKLNRNQIQTIEPGAFQGDYSGADVDLSYNNLTRFEELVFKEMLEQMVNQSSGSLNAHDNPFDCLSDPCHLAWLTRDNRQLLNRLSADCSDGTSFQQLNSSAVSQCGNTNSSMRPFAQNQLIKIIVSSIIILLGKKILM